ncbi:siderophore-interacting protein [Williamsia sp.]|uniref:siderophore-interacting protein n=1 Tax=Williamsia sp. TaxID=1872085 RepID=UPI002F93E648
MPKTSRRLAVHPISLRELEVARIADVTPGMRRVTLTGTQLATFTSANGLAQPPFRSEGFDDDIRLIFPYPGKTEPVLPMQADGHLDWPDDPRALSRVYTIRRWDAAAHELEVDFVKHGTGLATTWAYSARPGDRLHVAGPAASRALPTADWLLVAGDDTALPAIARLLEELPVDARGQVIIEIAHTKHRQRLRDLPGVVVTWLVRHNAPTGPTALLLDAVRAVKWWDGHAFAWIAGESTAVKAIRRHLVEERDMAKQDIQFTGYWRRGEVITLDNDPAIPDPERNEEAFDKLHELGEFLPPFAIRSAVTLGIPDLIARGTTTVTDLTVATGANPLGVGKLLRYLNTLDLVEQTAPGHYRLSEVGEYLTDDFVVEILHEDGYHARRELAFHGLTHAIRTGHEGYTTVTGNSYEALLGEDWYATKHHEHAAETTRYYAEPLAHARALTGIEHLLIRSDAPAVIAHALIDTHRDIRVTIAGLPSHIAWVREDMPETIPDNEHRSRVTLTEKSLFETAPGTDAILFDRQLGTHHTDDAVHALRQAASSLTVGGRLLIIEDTLTVDDLDEHESEVDLLNYALHGTGLRTVTELTDLFHAADLSIDAAETIGWGTILYTVTQVIPQKKGTTE